jgi:hypothetical protein
MDITILIIIGGVITFLLFLTTFLGGMRIIKMNVKLHKKLAITTLILALIHGTIAILYFTGIISF